MDVNHVCPFCGQEVKRTFRQDCRWCENQGKFSICEKCKWSADNGSKSSFILASRLLKESGVK